MSDLRAINLEIGAHRRAIAKLQAERTAWFESRRDEIRRRYEANEETVREIAAAYGTSQGAVQKLAGLYGWRKRDMARAQAQRARREREGFYAT